MDKVKINTHKLKMETQHFTIVYSEIDKACVSEVSEVLEDNYSEITNKFQQLLEEKLTIEIYSNLKQLHLALGFPDAPDWIRGGLGVNKIVIASPLNPPLGSEFDNVVKTAVHEFVHILIKKINSQLPRWLDEGIACYEAKDNNQKWIEYTVKKGLEDNSVPSFEDLDTGEDFQAFFQKDGYQYSYTIVEAIINSFGYVKLLSLVKSPEEIKDALGITKEELQNGWIQYISDNYL